MISINTFSTLVDAIYEAGLDPQRWSSTIAKLAAASSATVADLMIADTSRGAFARFAAGMDPVAIEAYREHYGRLDPIRPAAERNPPGAIISDRDILSKRQLT